MSKTIVFKNANKKAIQGQEFIFPILKGNNPDDLTCVGTGFFIGNYGIFATAAHVIEDVLDVNGNVTGCLLAICFLPPNNCALRQVRKATVHQKADVAVGALDILVHKETKTPLRNKVVRLTTVVPAKAEKIMTWAYPETKIDKDQSTTSFYFEPKLYTGKIIEEFRNGKPGKVSGPCYISDLGIEHGTSGGPVFDSRLNVFAINSGGYQGTDISILSHIQEIGNLKIPNVQTEDEKIHEEISIYELIKMGKILSYGPTQEGSK